MWIRRDVERTRLYNNIFKKFTRIWCLVQEGCLQKIILWNVIFKVFKVNISLKCSLKTFQRILIGLVKSQVPVSVILNVNTVWKQQLLFNWMFSRNQKCFNSTADVQFLSAVCCFFVSLCPAKRLGFVSFCLFVFYSLTGNNSRRENVSNVFNQLWENVKVSIYSRGWCELVERTKRQKESQIGPLVVCCSKIPDVNVNTRLYFKSHQGFKRFQTQHFELVFL